MVTWSKTCMGLDNSNIETAGSNTTRGLDLRFYVLASYVGRDVEMGRSPSRESYYTSKGVITSELVLNRNGPQGMNREICRREPPLISEPDYQNWTERTKGLKISETGTPL